MQLVAKKASIGILTLAFVLSSLLGAFGARAADNDERPFLGKVKDVTRTSVVLPIKFGELKKKDVIARVRIKNTATGAVEVRKFEFKLSKNGRESILVTNLKPGTKYEFKVKLRKETIKRFTDNSRTRKATTLP